MVGNQELLRIAREDYAVFSNAQKSVRERWVVDQWLAAREVAATPVRSGGDPPDFIVGSDGVEVVEVQEPGRRRSDQYRARRDAAERGETIPRKLVSRKRVVSEAHEWLLRAIEQKSTKYGAASTTWTLLIYANFPFVDCLAWGEVAASLETLAPPFAAIDVLFGSASGSVATTIWRGP